MSDNWQPIETAPKRERVLVLVSGKYVHIAAYATYYNQFLRAECTGWWDRQDWFLENITHWMPLPGPLVKS